MSTQSNIIITSEDEVLSELMADAKDPQASAVRVASYMHKLAAGCGRASVVMQVAEAGGVAASGTVTLSSLANDDVVTVGGVDFTAKTSGASGDAEFNLGSDDTDAAANAAAVISAHPSLQNVCSATSAAAVITVTAANKSAMGNQVTLAISAHGSVSGARLSGGVDPTSVTLSLGL